MGAIVLRGFRVASVYHDKRLDRWFLTLHWSDGDMNLYNLKTGRPEVCHPKITQQGIMMLFPENKVLYPTDMDITGTKFIGLTGLTQIIERHEEMKQKAIMDINDSLLKGKVMDNPFEEIRNLIKAEQYLRTCERKHFGDKGAIL